MIKKFTELSMVLIALTVFAVYFTGCQTSTTDSTTENQSSNGNSIQSSNNTDTVKENLMLQVKFTKKSAGSGSSKDFTIDDYMTINDSLKNFKTFVNRRSDFTKKEKKKIISARTRQLEINEELMVEYKNILTEEEMDAYLVQPSGEALEAGMVPNIDTYDQAIKKIEKAKMSDPQISNLSKELNKVKGGILKKFVDKVQKEKSELLGF